jgi:tetratricopeptide (TPR) repeat protein
LYTGLNLAESYRKMGEFEQAVDYARQSLKLAQDTKDAYNGVWAVGEIAMAQQLSGLLDKACANLEKAATMAESVDSPDLTARINAFWARGLLLKNDMERASQVIETACAAGDPGMDFQVKVLRSLIMLRQGQGIQAGQAVDELLAQEGSAENGYHYALLVAIKVILGEDASSDSALDDVQAAYKRAIEASRYKGLVRQAQQEFEALLMADNRFTLLPVKSYLDQVVSEF